MKSESKKISNSYALEIIKAIVIAILISLVSILIMAFAIKIFNIPTTIIPIINQVIKGLSILLACLFSLKLPNNGWLRGIFVGILYVIIAFVIFSLLDGKFVFGLNCLNDIAIGSISGLISGIISVNIRKK